MSGGGALWFEKNGVRYTLLVQMESVDDDDHGIHLWPATEKDLELVALATGGAFWTADERDNRAAPLNIIDQADADNAAANERVRNFQKVLSGPFPLPRGAAPQPKGH